MPDELAHKRCFNHARREAAALCLECGRYFCRECVTEHEGRVLCAACLAKITGAGHKRTGLFPGLKRALQFALSFILLWTFFYMVGRSLLALPTSFHEGTIWHTDR